jgi:hypothetical protein
LERVRSPSLEVSLADLRQLGPQTRIRTRAAELAEHLHQRAQVVLGQERAHQRCQLALQTAVHPRQRDLDPAVRRRRHPGVDQVAVPVGTQRVLAHLGGLLPERRHPVADGDRGGR